MKRALLILGTSMILHNILHAQTISTYAGGGVSVAEGVLATSAAIGYPAGGAFDRIGNFYFASTSKNKIFKVDTTGKIFTVAGNGTGGFSGDNGLATAAQLNYPVGVAVDESGNIFISDYYNYRLRKVDAVTHIISTIAGNGIASSTGDNGLGVNATLIPNGGVCVDVDGNVYIKDSATRIRKVTTSNIISTVAGNNINSCTGDNGPAVNSTLSITYGICLDDSGNIYTECGHGGIRKIDKISGIITKRAGNGNGMYIGDGMHSDSAQFEPYGIAIDGKGQLYIADFEYDRIYQIDTNNVFHLVAGTGVAGYSGDNGPAISAQIYNPAGIAVDVCGNLYISDLQNRRIRKVTFNPNCAPANTVKPIAQTEKYISIYPNPAADELTITGADKSDISIINTLGQVLIEQKQYAGNASINVSALSVGVYYVVVRDRVTGEKVTRRFVKE